MRAFADRARPWGAGLAFMGLVALAACGRTGFGLGQIDSASSSAGDVTATATATATIGDDGPTTSPSTTSPDTGVEPDVPGDECRTATECDLGDVCVTVQCIDGYCVYEPRDNDGDGWAPFECGGDDCNDLNPNVFPGNPEDCFDGSDNDCNGVSDCFDPVCEGVPGCGCTPDPGGENCGNGADDDCDMTVDCNDTDCIGTPACGCAESEAGLCVNGFDDDCDDAIDCDDDDCASSDVCLCMNTFESCGNGEDDDCDLLIDCADPDCEGLFPCNCEGMPTPEVCEDGLDNDCDELLDCADPDCLIHPACEHCEPEICDDGLDNNCDDRIDCADPACAFDPSCAPVPEICNNGIDDDNDTLIDCDDPDCANVPICDEQQANCQTAKFIPGSGTYTGETTGNPSNTSGSCGGDAGEAVFYFVLSDPSHVVLDSIGTSFDSVLYVRHGSCDSGKEVGCDDDSGGSAWSAKLDFTILYPGTYYVFLDGFTIDPDFGPNEGPFVLNVEITPNPPEVCNDGLDNDGDIYVDCGDPDCVNAPSCFNCNGGNPPTAEFGVVNCDDGLDNDCDGDVDCADRDCSASDYYVTECCNGMDQNDNGIPDDFNCRCANDAECDFGQICYTHTAYACGYPCDAFFGDVCPFVAPGSFCNASTQQCEF